tara:strand:- start:8996 stop:9400 length:405 start_codon:yes stop_codon:yes gene_type:complete
MARVVNKIDLISRVVEVSNQGLTKLVVSEGNIKVFCSNNEIRELIIPEGVKTLFCSDNKLTKLTLPDGIRELDATNNPNLKELTLPMSLLWANLDPHTKITNLLEVSNDSDMRVRFISLVSREQWYTSDTINIR